MSNNSIKNINKFINTSSSSSSSGTTTCPSIQNLLVVEGYNEPSEHNEKNEQNNSDQSNEQSDTKKRKRDQTVANDKFDLWTDSQIEVLIPLYGEYYRKTNDKARIRSRKRLQLNKKDLENLRRAFIEQTGVQRTEKDLIDKWRSLKQQYREKYVEKGQNSVGCGPLNRIDSLIHDIVIDDPTVYPVATFDSFTGRIEVRKSTSGSNPGPVQKRPRRAPIKRKDSKGRGKETILDGIKRSNEKYLDKMKKIMETPIVVKIEGSEERQKSFDRAIDILEKMVDKLE